MYSLVYVSSARQLFSEADLLELLAKSQRANERVGVTGLLLYKDGNFMQVLEGEKADVLDVHAKIARDPRHTGLLTLTQGPMEQRSFTDWSMGFRNLNSPEVRELPGYSEFLNTPLTGAEFAGDVVRSQKLLLTFKRGM